MSDLNLVDRWIESLQILAGDADNPTAEQRATMAVTRRKMLDTYAHELAETIRQAWANHDPKRPGNVTMLSALNAADLIDPQKSAGLVRPGEEPGQDDEEPFGGHDFQWGNDHVQRCTRCTLPHSQWAGGSCPGPEHPLKPGEYV